MPMSSRSVWPWLVLLGSAALICHFVAIFARLLAAPTGPWASPFGEGMAPPAQFAQAIDSITGQTYLKALRLIPAYPLPSRPASPEVHLEVWLRAKDGKLLRDKDGKLLEITIPDDRSNSWVQHRQALLARGLGDDQPVIPPQGEPVAAPGRQLANVHVWEEPEPGSLVLQTLPEHHLIRPRPGSRPSEWSLLLARSYARYLCRTHNAASAEVIRHSRDPIPPAILLPNGQPPGELGELRSNFGELPR